MHAFFRPISKTDATREPVQAPVPGSGIPTNSISPQKPYLSIFGLFFLALASSQSAHMMIRHKMKKFLQQQKNERDRQNIAGNTENDSFPERYIQKSGHNQTAALFNQRKH